MMTASAWHAHARAGVLIPLGLLASARVYAAPSTVELRAELERALADFDEAQGMQRDQPGRARQLFRLAAQRFGSIVAAGVVNGRLEYNLGNCYLQAGDVGRAILHYRRAERLIPQDEMLADNLRLARSRCLTTIQRSRRSAFLRSVFFWHYQTSAAGRVKAALFAYIAVWGLLIVRTIGVNMGPLRTARPGLTAGPTCQSAFPRRALTVAAIACTVFAVGAGMSAAMTRWSDRNAPLGVVTNMDVVVYGGPGAAYQRRFEQPLQPGVEFTLRERRADWFRIELADGKSGWIEATQAELIPDRRAIRSSA